MKAIFLDVDCVLNHAGVIGVRAPSGIIGVEDVLIDRLAQIVEVTDAKIILVSTWKEEWHKDRNQCGRDALYLTDKLADFGLEIYDKTTNEDRRDRGKGIREYVENKQVEKFVILDDTDYGDYAQYNLVDNIVHTKRATGLTDENIEEAINMLL